MATILAVDDSATMREMVSSALRSAGHTVIEALDGEDALQKVKTRKVDLVLSDINMPRMDGLTFLKQLRTLPGCQNIPVLMLTTECSAELKAEGKMAGALGWIIKPFHAKQMLGAIQKLLESSLDVSQGNLAGKH